MIEIGDKYKDGIDTVFTVIDVHDNFEEEEENVYVEYKRPYHANKSKTWLSYEWIKSHLTKLDEYYKDKDRLNI